MTAKRPLVHSSGAILELPDTDTVRLGELAVAAGATTPNPGAKVIAWSTVDSAWIGWNGSAWTLIDAGGGASFTPAEVDEVIPVHYYISPLMGPVCLSYSGGLLLDLTLPTFGGITPTVGELVLISDTTYSGLWVLGSVASPSAIPLTRHANYGSGSGFAVGTQFNVRTAPLEYSTSSLEQIPTSGLIEAAAVFPGTDSLVTYICSFAPLLFRLTLLGDAVAPGGLTPGNWYLAAEPVYNPTLGYFESVVQDPVTLTPINITSTGTNDTTGSGELASMRLMPPSCAWAIMTITSPSTSGALSMSSVFADGYLEIFQASYPADQLGAVLPGTKSQASSSGTAYGRAAAAGLSALAVGYYAHAKEGGIALGPDALANKYGIAVGYATAAPNSIGIGRNTYSESQIAFNGPGGTSFRDSFEIQQFILHSNEWSVATYPAKLYTSYMQQTQMPTRSGWRVFGSYPGPTRFEGNCIVNFYASTTESIGTASLRVEGIIWKDNDASLTPSIKYSVIEEYSSYPGSLTLTLTPSNIATEYVATMEVELSCSIPIATVQIDAYMGLQVWTLQGTSAYSASYVTPQKIYRHPEMYTVKWAIIPYAEEFQTYSQTIVAGTYPNITLNLTHKYFTGSSALVPIVGDKVFVCNHSVEGIFIITDVSTPTAAILKRVPEFPSGYTIKDTLTVVVEGGGIDFYQYLIDHARFETIDVTGIDIANNIFPITVNWNSEGFLNLQGLIFGYGKAVWVPTNMSGTLPTGITGDTVYYTKIAAPVTSKDNTVYFKLYSDEACTTEVDITAVNSGTDHFTMQMFTPNIGAINYPYYIENLNRPIVVGSDYWAESFRLRIPSSVSDNLFSQGVTYQLVSNVDFGTNTQIKEISVLATLIGSPFGFITSTSATLLPPADGSNINTYEIAMANNFTKIIPIKILQTAGTTDINMVFLLTSEVGLSGKFDIRFDFRRDTLSSALPIVK